ncbi:MULTISPECIES: hypothetical protein [unclassified Bacillus (in: firmicutes)]|uniref:hypothetical protein n=1 Tax=unclassified Bacillus (in: firmicutes) TaxID=185979 RepID=UPI0004270595|nr:hypothetical protein [Bacillus sp. NSP9.1]QHZ45838.1 hypothetical protein M654_005655 [Bacillus sp. NSP9.1]
MSKTIKKGRFGVYHGKEYRIYEGDNGEYELVSNDPEDLQNGFVEEYPLTYVKNVKKEEIASSYRIIPYAIYQGEKLDISEQIKDGKVNLGTSDAAIAKKLNFERTDKYFHEKWIPKEEVQIVEEREEIKL